MAKNKHLTLDDRITIKGLLDTRTSFKAIAAEVGKDCTTISKEVRNHRIYRKTGAQGRAFNCCLRRRGCDHRRLCASCTSNRYCWSCKKCNLVCPDFHRETCGRLDRAPYVCNGCPDHKTCTLEKCFYHASAAWQEYRETLSESRQGLALSRAEVEHLDLVVSPLIRKGQSLNHICASNRDRIMVSKRTLYRLVGYGVFSARNIDLPRRVRYARRRAGRPLKVDSGCRAGRSYRDYKDFLAVHPDLPVVELDSVEGNKGGRVLLTLHFVRAEFMVAFLRDSNDSQSVIDIFERLFLELGPDMFMRLMPVLLADNGSEFSNPAAIECDRQGNQRTHLFYCDPASPHQKGSAERNHELIRYVIPKGRTFDDRTQEEISLMMSHVNSYCRESLGNKCPYDVFTFLYGERLPKALGIHRVAPNDVTLNASVFRKEEAHG